MKSIILLLIILCFSERAFPQLIENWVKRFNGAGNSADFAVSMELDIDKNIYVTGNSYNNSSMNDFVTVKYSQSGIQEWVKVFNGTGNDNDYATAMLIAGNDLYVTGYSLGSGTSYDFATVKYNTAGVQQWAVTYNGAGGGNDGSNAIAVDLEGNIYVVGESYGGTISSYDYATVKYNSSGVQQWVARYNGPVNGNDAAIAVSTDRFNNVYVTGKSQGAGSNLDYATIKYNSSGQEQWVARYNGTANYIDVGTLIAVSSTDQVTVSGFSSATNTAYDISTISYNTAGDELWVSKYNGSISGNDIPSEILIDNSGFIYLTGVANSDGGGIYSNYITLKYNSSGAIQWSAIYNGTGNGNDSATSLTLDNSGNVYVTGKSIGAGSSFDYVTNQYNSSGVLQYTSRFNSSGNSIDIGTKVKIDNSGNTYVAGSSNGAGTNDDYLTVKYSNVSGISVLSNEIPDKIELSQNYPNPFNPSTNITYSITSRGITKLKIVSVGGNEIETLVNESQNPGTYSVQWNAEKNPSGIYFYTLETEGITTTKKMILIK